MSTTPAVAANVSCRRTRTHVVEAGDAVLDAAQAEEPVALLDGDPR